MLMTLLPLPRLRKISSRLIFDFDIADEALDADVIDDAFS